MTKRKNLLKSMCAFVLCGLTALSAVMFTSAPSVYAAVSDDDVVTSNTVVVKPNYTIDDSADPDENGIANMAFAFENGASLSLEEFDDDGSSVGGLLHGQYKMRFTLKETDPIHENLLEWTETKSYRINNETYLCQDYFEYRFTVYRTKDENYAVPMTEFYIGLAYGGTVNDPYLYRITARKDFSYYDEIITPYGFIDDDKVIGNKYGDVVMSYLSEDPTEKEIATACNRVDAARKSNSGYTVLSYKEIADGGLFFEFTGENATYNSTRPTGVPSGDFVIETKNPNTGYFITFNYNYTVFTGYNYGIFSNPKSAKYGTREQDFGYCQTPTRSYYDIVNTMNSIEGELEMQADRTSDPEALIAQAEKVLYDGIKKVVKIEYLEQIPGTPFGAKKTAYVEVPVYDGAIFRTDVYNALDVSDLDVAGNNCHTFVFNAATNTYTAVYLEHVYLRMETADGQQRNYFLDINKSFNDFYSPLVDKGIISEEMFGYLLDGYYTAYPQLDYYASGEFYGLFGFTALPETVTIDKVFSEVFNLSEDIKDCKDVFNYQENISQAEYNTLLTDYDYGWLDKIWQDIWATVSGGNYMCTYYAFYCTGESRLASIDEVEGKGGAIGATIPEIPNYLKSLIDSIWGPIGNKITIIATAITVISTIITVIVVKKKNN